MLCMACRPVKPQPCAHCGKRRRPTAHWHEGPICQGCYDKALAAKGVCPSCGDTRRLRSYPGFGESVCSDCAGEPASHVCQRCGNEDSLYERGLCQRCVVLRRLDAILGDEEARAGNGLGPLFDALTGSSAPKSVLDWLGKSPKAVEALSSIGRGEQPLSYETIDDLEPVLGIHTARHLENLLGVSGSLPGRDPVLAAMERWCDRFLAGIEPVDHSQVLRAWVRWQVLRPLRVKAGAGPLLDSTAHSARGRLRDIADFLAFLVTRDRVLSACRQADVDTWASSQSRHRVTSLLTFATWATARRAMPRLDMPTGHRGLPVAPLAADDRWTTVRHLIHGPDVGAALRVAGTLVVLYAQPLFKVSRLTTGDLDTDDGPVVARISGAAIEFPEPLAGHARDLLAQRQPAPRKAHLPVDPGWLFPGKVPGRPITAQALSRQLARHGVRAERHRLTALFDFAAEMPAPLLADILGISRHTAERWSRLANRSWSSYPEMRKAE